MYRPKDTVTHTMSTDLVGVWQIALSDGIHTVEFEHGTTTGKRIIRVDGQEIMHKDWMFKLVGKEHFTVGKASCNITIEAVSGFAYEYVLEVNGKSLEKFKENQSKIMRSWVLDIPGNPVRVVLEKNTLDVWVNGNRVLTTGEFGDDGVETHFEIGSKAAFIRATTTGKRKDGVVHQLFVNEVEIPLAKE